MYIICICIHNDLLQSQQLKVQQRDAVQQVELLENSIKVYKSEYAGAIRDTEIIRTEMEQVTRKVREAL